MRRPRLFPCILAAAALAAAPAFLGCARGGRESRTPRRGGRLVVALAAPIDALNPLVARSAEAQVAADRLLPRLARPRLPDDGGAPGLEPGLAAAWEVADGGRAVSVALRPGRWSDGTPIVCADLQFTLRAQMSPEIGWRGAGFRQRIERIDCPAPDRAVVRFKAFDPDALLDAFEGNVLPRALDRWSFHSWRTADWVARLVTAGPFRVGPERAGAALSLERDAAWGGASGRPYIDRIDFRVVPDPTARMNELLAGNVDVADGLTPWNAARLAADPDVRIERRRGWSYAYLGWNTIDPAAYAEARAAREADCAKRGERDCPDDPQAIAELARRRPHPLFGDPRARRALTLAIDRAALVRELFRGDAEVPASPILAPLPEHDPSLAPWPYDPLEARRLLAAAGFAPGAGGWLVAPDGRPFSFELVYAAAPGARAAAAVEMIRRDLARIGVALHPRAAPPAEYAEALARRRIEAWFGGWQVSSRVDTGEILGAPGRGRAGANYGGFADAEADDLAARARTTEDPAARAALWRRWEARFHALQPYTILFRPPRLVGLRTRVRGAASLSADDPLRGVEDWWLEETPRP